MRKLLLVLTLIATQATPLYAIERNVASQKLTVFAFDADGSPVTGDAANITAYVAKDDGTLTALTDTSATERDATNAPGEYLFDLTQGETDAVKLGFTAKSSTSGVQVYGSPPTVYTTPPNSTLLAIDVSGRVDVGELGGDAQSLTDLKDFADAGYDPSTNKIEGVKLADAVTNVTNPVKLPGILYVSKSGNDSNDGLSWSTAKLTISAANTAAGSNEAISLIRIGAGTFSENFTVSKTGLTFQGIGFPTIVTASVAAGSSVIVPLSNTRLLDMAITNTGTGAAVYGFNVSNIEMGRCKLTGQSDGIIFVATEVHAGLWVHECEVYGTFDAAALSGMTGVLVENSYAFSDGTYDTGAPLAGIGGIGITAVSGVGGTGIVRNCIIECVVDATNGNYNSSTILHGLVASSGASIESINNRVLCTSNDASFNGLTRAVDCIGDTTRASVIDFKGGRVYTSGGTPSVDYHFVGTGTTPGIVRVSGASYDPAKLGSNVQILDADVADTKALANGASGFAAIKGVADGTKAVTDALGPRLPGSGTISTHSASDVATAVAASTPAEEFFDNAPTPNVELSPEDLEAIADAVDVDYEAIAEQVRTELATELAHLDADVSSRAASSSLPANFAALGINASGHIGRVTTADQVTSVNDKTGYSLDGVTFPTGFNTLTVSNIQSGLATSANLATLQGDVDAVKAATDKLDAAFAESGVFSETALANAPSGDVSGLPTLEEILQGMVTEDTGETSAASGSVVALSASGITEQNIEDIGEAAGLAAAEAIWTAETRTLTAPTNLAIPSAADIRNDLDANSTKLANLDVTLSSRLATSGYTAPPAAATVASATRTELSTELGRIDATISSRNAVAPLDAAGTRAALGMASANLDAQIEGIEATVDLSPITDKLPSDGAKMAGEGATAKNLDQVSADVDLTPVQDVTDKLNTLLADAGGGLWTLTVGAFANQPPAEVELTEQDKSDIANEVAEKVGSSAFSDVDQEPVGEDRTILLEPNDSDGLVGEKVKTLAVGSTPTFAVDFRKNMAVNSWITIVGEPTIVGGTAGGITFDQMGRDKSLAKFRATGVTAGTYRVRVPVTYYGGASAAGFITLKVVE